MKTVIKALCVAGVSLLGLALPSSAQTRSEGGLKYKYEFNLMVGMTPGVGYAMEEFPDYYPYSWGGELSDFYKTYTKGLNYTPFFTTDFNVSLTKWLKVGATVGYARFWADQYNPRQNSSIGEKTLNDISLMGQVKFTFVNRQIFRMYAGGGVGAAAWVGKDNGESYSKLVPVIEFIPLGFQWTGHKVFTTMEIALGDRMMGVRAGLGYRF